MPYGQTLLRMTELPTISSDSLPSSNSTRECISPASASTAASSNSTVIYTFNCSPWSNATANINWTATLASHSGLATFDGYQHWIDLFQPNNGIDTSPRFPSVTGGPTNISLTFYSTRSDHGYCLLDVGVGVGVDGVLVCVEAGGNSVRFSVWDDEKEYKLVGAANVADKVWNMVEAEVTSVGEMRLSLNHKSIASLTAVVPAVKPRLTASLGRQSAPNNDGYALFQGHMDTFMWQTRPTIRQSSQPSIVEQQ